MILKMSELRCKEVICLYDGRRLGYVSDLELECPTGEIKCIIVPGQCKFWGIFGPKEDYVIPWCNIQRIGPDIILVDIDPNGCCVPRMKRGFA